MGEAKRRKATEPDYGKKPKAPPKPKKRRFNFDIQKISKTEMVIWAGLIGAAAATFFWTNSLQ